MKSMVQGVWLSLLAALFAPVVLAQAKPVVAVIEFKNDSGAAWWRGGVGWELSGMLSNELAATGDFRVLERTKLEAVMSEQDLAMSGRVDPSTGAKFGKLVGAQYLVAGTVTAYEENTASTGGGLSFGGVSLGGKKSEAYLAIDLRVIDSSTGEIAFVRTVEGRSKGGGVNLGLYRGGFGGSLDNEKNTPVGKSIRAALVEASDYLTCVMVQKTSGCKAFDAKVSKRRNSSRGALELD